MKRILIKNSKPWQNDKTDLSNDIGIIKDVLARTEWELKHTTGAFNRDYLKHEIQRLKRLLKQKQNPSEYRRQFWWVIDNESDKSFKVQTEKAAIDLMNRLNTAAGYEKFRVMGYRENES